MVSELFNPLHKIIELCSSGCGLSAVCMKNSVHAFLGKTFFKISHKIIYIGVILWLALMNFL